MQLCTSGKFVDEICRQSPAHCPSHEFFRRLCRFSNLRQPEKCPRSVESHPLSHHPLNLRDREPPDHREPSPPSDARWVKTRDHTVEDLGPRSQLVELLIDEQNRAAARFHELLKHLVHVRIVTFDFQPFVESNHVTLFPQRLAQHGTCIPACVLALHILFVHIPPFPILFA